MKIRKTNSMRALLVMLVITAGGQQGQAQQVYSFTAAQAVDYALKNAVEVKNSLIDLQIQQQTNREITAAAFPQLSGSASTNYFPNVAVQSFPNFIAAATYGVLQQEGVKDGNGNTIVAPTDFGIVQAQFGTKYTASGGVDFSQLLFDGQVFVGLQARDASLDFARKQTAVTEEMIKVNVQKIYYQLVVGRQQATSIDANISRFEKLLNDTRKIYENGFAEKLDVDKVSVQLNNLLTEKIKVENQLRAGNASLKFLMNMPQKDQLLLTDSLSEDMVKGNVLDQAYSYTDRKEYQLLQIAQRLGQYNIKRYQLSYLPTVALYGNYYKNAQRNQFDFFKRGPWFPSSLVGLKISVPIFDGFAKAARVSKARLELQKTNNKLQQLEFSIDNDVEQAKLKLTSSLLTIDNQRKNMELAEKVYNTTKIKYEQGLGSNQEIYTAQTELKMAQNNYYGALYDAVIARIDFLKATGKL
ncbi:MAG: TolC family protein [Chitinophagaceae bacterium]|nr:MAG: TolC family protein [Chitinophagaceae bacterium]